MKYKILLFDADETLLDFRKAEKNALQITFSAHGITPTEALCQAFSEVNAGLWKQFEKKEIEKSDIINRRFRDTLSLFDIPYSPGQGLEKDYQAALSLGHDLVENAESVCRTLAGHFRMYIVTNGLLSTQTARLSDSGLMRFFKDFFVSEKIGFQKPSPQYFDAVIKAIGSPPKSEILIIGDSCSSDINGGIMSGIDTSWFNPKNLPMTALSQPTFTIRSLFELYEILGVNPAQNNS